MPQSPAPGHHAYGTHKLLLLISHSLSMSEGDHDIASTNGLSC